MKDLISIIVPVYNVEKYLGKCLDTIINQTYKNIEILVVNDGSTDDSDKILKEYYKKDKRIRIINKKNGGLSSARNKGIDKASGKYLSFIDSDDYIENDMIETLYKTIFKEEADISICEFIEEDEMNPKQVTQQQEVINIYNKDEAIKELILDKKITNHAWNKLYKKDLFENIRYPEGRNMEDIATTYKLFLKSNKIVKTNQIKYHYIQRSNSIMGQLTKKRINETDLSYSERINYLKKIKYKYIDMVELDELRLYKTLFYLSAIGNHKDNLKSNKYAEYYKIYKDKYPKIRNNIINAFSKKSIISYDIFFLSKTLYTLQSKMKGIKK